MSGGGWAQPIREAREACEARRARVLAHPDIADLLTKPPLKFARPEQWTGYIAPAVIESGRGTVTNTSPRRAALIAICQAVAEREREADE